MTNATIKLSQGKRIRYAREAAGLKQQELADLLRVSRSALSAWEDDKNRRGVPYNDLVAIAKHTGFDVEFFEDKEVTFIPTISPTVNLENPSRRRTLSQLVGSFQHPSRLVAT